MVGVSKKKSNLFELIQWPLNMLRDVQMILFKYFSNSSYEMISRACHVKLVIGEYQRTLFISKHWFRLWPGVVRQQAITWNNVDPDLCYHVVTTPQWVQQLSIKCCLSRFLLRHQDISSPYAEVNQKSCPLFPHSYQLDQHQWWPTW